MIFLGCKVRHDSRRSYNHIIQKVRQHD
jgi:hypothetical protein